MDSAGLRLVCTGGVGPMIVVMMDAHAYCGSASLHGVIDRRVEAFLGQQPLVCQAPGFIEALLVGFLRSNQR